MSVVLMLTGFLLLSLLSAALASLFVREDVEPAEERELDAERDVSAQLAIIADRLERLEAQVAALNGSAPGSPGPGVGVVSTDEEER